MLKLDRQIEALESVLEKIEEKIETLEEKKQNIYYNAIDHDRDLTHVEKKRVDRIDEEIEEIEEVEDIIKNALNYIMEYVD